MTNQPSTHPRESLSMLEPFVIFWREYRLPEDYHLVSKLPLEHLDTQYEDAVKMLLGIHKHHPNNNSVKHTNSWHAPPLYFHTSSSLSPIFSSHPIR